MDTRMRSLVKSVSWRVVATGFTFGFSYLWLQDISASLGLSFAVNAAKGGAYYLHERVWNVLSWGRVPEVSHEAVVTAKTLEIEEFAVDTSEDAVGGSTPEVVARLP